MWTLRRSARWRSRPEILLTKFVYCSCWPIPLASIPLFHIAWFFTDRFHISLFCLLYTMHTKYFHWNPPQYMDVGINSWEQLPHTYRNFSSYWLLFTVRLGRFGCALVKLACCSSLMAAKVTALHSIIILFVSLQTYCMYISPPSWLTIIFIILSFSTGIEIRSLQCSTVHKVPCGHTGESPQLATVASFRCLDI